MAWPTKPNAGDLIEDTLLDAIIDALALWGGNVNAAGYTLDNVGQMLIDGVSGSNRAIYFQTSNSTRWTFSADATAESGSNGGSNLVLSRYNDAGALLGTALSLTRSSGLWTSDFTAPGGTSGNQQIFRNWNWAEAGNGMHLELVSHRHTTGSGHGTDEFHIRRKVDATVMGYVGFGSTYVSIGTGAGAEELRVEASGFVKIANLPSSNPGAGTKRLWYDPADGNRVKFAA